MRMSAVNRIDIVAACWIVLIAAFLMGNLSNTPLWQDEAEYALNALTISWGSLIPKGSTDGNPALMHETSLYYDSNDPKYEYLPTHYLYTLYVTLHGWVPYYFVKLGLEIFGKNEFGPRFFSVIFFALSLWVLYLITREKCNWILAVSVVACCSLMPTMLGFAMQARWYAYMLCFHLSAIYFFMGILKNNKGTQWFLWAVSEVLLYYTFIPASVLHQVVFVLFILIARRDLLCRYVACASMVGFFALPHLIITRFPQLALKIPGRHIIEIKDVFRILYLLEWNPFLILLGLAFFARFAIIIAKRARKQNGLNTGLQFDFLCILLICINFLISSYTSPLASFYPRVFLPIVPIVIYAAVSFVLTTNKGKPQYSALRLIALVGLLLFLIFSPLKIKAAKAMDLFSLGFQPTQGHSTDAKWVLDVIRHIESTGSKYPVVLTSFEHFVFNYYSDYKTELIWPLRKEYIDNIYGDLFIVVEEGNLLRDRCETFLPSKSACKEECTMKHFARASSCNRVDISNVTIYECLNDSER